MPRKFEVMFAIIFHAKMQRSKEAKFYSLFTI
jgi:hypothetical protein